MVGPKANYFWREKGIYEPVTQKKGAISVVSFSLILFTRFICFMVATCFELQGGVAHSLTKNFLKNPYHLRKGNAPKIIT
jgi:hypothetical protein